MANSQVHPQGWISLLIAPEYEERAKRMRAERDRQYGNIYAEEATDERWVGDLGEMVFNSWLKHEGVQGFQWVLDDAAGQPDFVTALNIRIGVKTVKRKVPPREDYTAQITARHAREPIDQFFFMTYEIAHRRMWLLGGLERERFLQEARYYQAGEWVHPKYQVRQGHEIYNIEISKLVAPHLWIKPVA
ncbi:MULTISPECIES: hypothetical protein [Acetobacteraceae]|jgi:hypothetical protein|uniref:hypothetical protein n=1 Tax=Acetobacteraceae TaxID=433 RepID=UPI00078093CD|nr:MULTISPECIES: hypothetical protein [Acetobacteraceae]KXV66955.1 hypothetical protein AD950_00640 [Gluconobacter oxydans]MCP1228956.1 hypothetical protein [Acetobacter fabarum]MCP1234451.1 hypothetical protein [Acetobacter fabarum]GFE98132.1 hypothetical protein DmGdi_32050 [Gluconobacter sp. Gdi]